MHGNVEEWCADWHGSYPTKAVTDPKGPSSGFNRVLRGGCCCDDAEFCRSAFRNSDSPADGDGYYGFRLCCSVDENEV